MQFKTWFKIPDQALANQKFQLKAVVQTALDKRQFNNVSVFNDVIRNSLDPNDKLVQEIRDPNSDSSIGDLLYTIRFQNTGNDTAYNITIKDTLSNYLDPKTIRIVNYSHPCKLKMEVPGIAEFQFLNINLLDSFQHENKSHGFVQFLINPKNKVSNNTNITNRASIYFDLNTPVITNEVSTSFATIQNNYFNDLQFEIYPNPVNDCAFIHDHSILNHGELSVVIFGLDGNLIYTQKLTNSADHEVCIDFLKPGLYYLKLMHGIQLVGIKKFVKF